jgi:hypothetical protein
MELWVGCIAGALSDVEYRDKLTAAGFADVSVEPWREYSLDDARTFLTAGGLDVDALSSKVDGRIASAFVRAQKPVRRRAAAASAASERQVAIVPKRLPVNSSAPLSCWPPSWARASWASGSPAATSRLRCWPTRSPRARLWWRSS